MKQFRNWLLAAAGLILVCLLLIAALVVYVDPFFHYHKPLTGFPYQVDNQLSQNPGLARHTTYDSAILGSSMTVNFNTNWFTEEMGLDTRKLSYSGAYPKDQANILNQVYRSGNEVKNIFLGVDVITYSGGVEETKYPIPEYLYDENMVNDISYLWNKDVLLQYILRPLADPEPTDLATSYASWWTDEYYNIQWVMHNYTSPEPVEEEVDSELYIPGIKANLEANIIPCITNHPETEFDIFFPPYSILFWNDTVTTNQLEAVLREYEFITQTLLAYENVRIFFFCDMEEIVTDLNNYADYTHYHPDINHLMTKSFANGDYEIHSEAELSERLQHMREIVNAFDFEALFAVDWG